MGITGQGKTSFLNYLGNIEAALNIKSETDEAMIKEINDLSKENNIENRMTSKTEDVTRYRIKIGHLSLLICDTPGLGDTKGLESDRKNSNYIKEDILNLGGVNCIMIV